MNEGAVTRYPDETHIAPATLLATRRLTQVRSQASRTEGELLAELKSGTGVVRIAQRDDFFLILFDEPSDLSRQDMGWVNRDAFLPDLTAKRTPIRCGTAQVAIVREETETCVAPCSRDSQCPNGGTCSGNGVRSNDGQQGPRTRFCVPHVVPLYGPPSPPDASATMNGE